MNKYLQESYDALLKENSEILEQNKKLLQRIEIAQNELGKIYQLANGLNANDMIIREKAEYALDQLKE